MAEINFFTSYTASDASVVVVVAGFFAINSHSRERKLMKLFELLSINLICLLNLLHRPFFLFPSLSLLVTTSVLSLNNYRGKEFFFEMTRKVSLSFCLTIKKHIKIN
jgi:hypothetical protein